MAEIKLVENPLKYYLSSYCNVNAVQTERLRALFLRPEQEKNAQAFREELNTAIETGSLSKDEYEHWTDEDFDTQEDFIEWLRTLRTELFGDLET